MQAEDMALGLLSLQAAGRVVRSIAVVVNCQVPLLLEAI